MIGAHCLDQEHPNTSASLPPIACVLLCLITTSCVNTCSSALSKWISAVGSGMWYALCFRDSLRWLNEQLL